MTGYAGGAFKELALNDALLSHLPGIEGRSLLELGAGNGYFMPLVLRRFSGQIPAAIVVTEAFETDAAYEQFTARLNDRYGGPTNAGKAMVVEAEGEGGVAGAIDVKVLGLSQKDALFIEQHKAALEQVAIALGVPWSMLDAAGRTFDNASEEAEHFWRNTIVPMCETLADEVNLELAPRLGAGVGWFDFSGVEVLRTRSVPVTQTVGAPSMVQAQLMTINEARADYGLDPVPDGDRMMTAEEIAALRGGGVPGEAPAARASEPAATREAPAVQEPAPRVAAPEPAAPDPEAIEARRATIWRRTDATVRTLERRWARAFPPGWRTTHRPERSIVDPTLGARGGDGVR